MILVKIKSQKIYTSRHSGFTLIELLVVIAIIGILSSVVLASLNSARKKGQEAAIKSNLKNMIAQAELTYEATGNYSTACASVANMITAINNSGGTASCYSFDNSRWGVSARLNSDSTKNWSVDGTGVATWSFSGAPTGSLSWDGANTACSSLGGRLPSLEQLNALYLAYGGLPPGLASNYYWSSNYNPTISTNAYYVHMSAGVVGNGAKTNGYYARCVY